MPAVPEVVSRLEFRQAAEPDVPSLVSIEKRGASEDCYSAEDFYAFLEVRRGGILVAADGKFDLAYAALVVRKKAVVVYSLVVHPGARRMGVGSALLARVKARDGAKEVTCSPRESDLAAQLFLRANKFVCGEILDDAYHHPPEAAYHFHWRPGYDSATLRTDKGGD